MKPEAETEHRRDPRRSGQRSLAAAEGVLVALRLCSLDEAFTDIVQTAKRHNVAPMLLTDALVAIAENDVPRDVDEVVVAATAAADDDGVHIWPASQTHWPPTVIEPIPRADEADIAEQARPVDDGIEECDALPDSLGDSWDADATDVFDQKLSVSGQDDDHPPATDRAGAVLVTSHAFWLTWESNPLTTQRSSVEDVASRNEPYRPDW